MYWCECLQHAATSCYTLQHTATKIVLSPWLLRHTDFCWTLPNPLQPNEKHYITLQPTSTHCNKQLCNPLQQTSTHPIHSSSATGLAFTTHYSTLQHAGTRCNTLQHTLYIHVQYLQYIHIYVYINIYTRVKYLQHAATNCNTQQQLFCHSPPPPRRDGLFFFFFDFTNPTATHCNPLQPTATHCNPLQPLRL